MIKYRRIIFLPLIFFLLSYIFSNLGSAAEEEVFYSRAAADSTALAVPSASAQFPRRRFVSLNGRWGVLLEPAAFPIGRVNVPFTYRGGKTFLFRKKFQLRPAINKKYFLRLNRVSGNFSITVNGHSIYSGEANVFPLRLPILRSYLTSGENRLSIRLTPFSPGRIDRTTWFPLNIPRIEYGITGPVYLEERSRPALSGVEIKTFLAGDTLHVSARINLPRVKDNFSDFRFMASIRNGGKKTVTVTAKRKSAGTGVFTAPEIKIPHPEVWSPQNPRQTFLKIRLDSAGIIIDEIRRPVAVRNNLFRSGQKRLPPKEAIRGINYVYQDARGTTLFDPCLVRKDLRNIRRRGYNAVRVVFSPLPEEFYQLCDSLGLQCFQDLPFFPGLSGAGQGNPYARWKRQYASLISLAKRHPSITAIGVGFFMDNRNEMSLSTLKNFLTKLPDSPVPIYVVSPMPTSRRITGIRFLLLDLLRRNHPEVLTQKLLALQNSHRIVLSGFSKSLSYRLDSTKVTFDRVQLQQLANLVRTPRISEKFPGSFIPTYSDYYLNFPSVQNGKQGRYSLNRVGLVNLNRQRNRQSEGWKQNLQKPTFISEARSSQSYIYIIIGIINFFVFFFFYRKFIDFRQSLHHSIKKPHGFFINLQERIIIPYGQSALLLLVIALNGAIVLSSLGFFFRNNLIFDYLLSLVFFGAKQKEFVAQLIWHQSYFIIFATLAIIVSFFLFALPIKLLSFFGESRVPFRQALAISIWSASPFVFLIPLGIFLYNLLLTMKSYWILIGVLLYFHVWFVFRWINGARVLTEFLYSRIWLIVSGCGFILAGGIFYFYQQKIMLFNHLVFIFHLFYNAI